MGRVTTVSVLGSTGSIGTQTLDVARWRGYRVTALAAGGNAELLIEQAREFRPQLVSCSQGAYAAVREALPVDTSVLAGADGAEEVAAFPADAVVAAIPGMAGLAPVRSALRHGRRVALAGKEAMVVAAPLIRAERQAHGGEIVPVDSEHSALFQCLVGEDPATVAEMIITASGGPFLHSPASLDDVTPAQALRHPNWSMGPKVTIDSATLFNKGLEVLEAQGLFDLPLERISVLVHPQSLVHGLVRFTDGVLKAQVGPHDMRLPIQYGIEFPSRPPVPLEPLPLTGTWEFLEPDTRRFPSLELAYEAGRRGGYAPVYLNAADEVAVPAFLGGEISFSDIPRVLERTLAGAPAGAPAWDDLAAADAAARVLARELVAARKAIL